jgi:hypothetical protein
MYLRKISSDLGSRDAFGMLIIISERTLEMDDELCAAS